MQIFLDTAELDALRAAAETGLIDGVTTNPSLIAKSGRPFLAVLEEICDLIGGPVSAEVTATDAEIMIAEGRKLRAVAANVVVKAPLTVEGLKATRALAEEGVAVNVTLCFSANQALLAAKAGASYISPFIGRLDDLGQDGLELIREIRAIYDVHDFSTEVLAASIRHPLHVRDVAIAGADAVTIPPKIFEALYRHPLTDQGLDAFMQDWASTGQSVL
ncbi:MAG: fructose-6-phosphate aldolase [Maricaulaceae bacterium]